MQASRLLSEKVQAAGKMPAYRRGVAMTILLEDALPEPELASPAMVKCSWCGEIIRLDGNELALAMCQTCYDQMLREFLRAQQANQAPTHPSDR